MRVNIKKVKKVDLKKYSPALTEITVGLGWSTNDFMNGYPFDLDVSCFLLNQKGKYTRDVDMIFYNNLEHPSKAVIHTGDNRTGSDNDEDDEQIIINFSKMPEDIERVAFTVTIDDALRRKQNFGMVRKAYIRLIDNSTQKELLRYNLEEEFSVETALVVAEVYKKDNSWQFNAIGEGFRGGLESLCENYGLDVE